MPSLDSIPPRDRVRERSPSGVNARIDRATKAAIARRLRSGRLAVLERIAELDREWDVDRSVAALCAIAAVAGVAAATRIPRLALALFGAELVVLGVHALRGWSPPAVLLRRLGVRTRQEIEQERYILIGELERAFG